MQQENLGSLGSLENFDGSGEVTHKDESHIDAQDKAYAAWGELVNPIAEGKVKIGQEFMLADGGMVKIVEYNDRSLEVNRAGRPSMFGGRDSLPPFYHIKIFSPEVMRERVARMIQIEEKRQSARAVDNVMHSTRSSLYSTLEEHLWDGNPSRPATLTTHTWDDGLPRALVRSIDAALPQGELRFMQCPQLAQVLFPGTISSEELLRQAASTPGDFLFPYAINK